MDISTYLSLLISPLILLVVFMFIHYNYKPHTWKNVRNAVLAGMAGTLVLLVFSYITQAVWHGQLFNLRRISFFVFVTIAFGAELGKFIPLRYSFFKKPGFRGPLEGIRYSVMISLGYSVVAVALFAFNIVGTKELVKTPLLFLYTYPFANIFFGIAMGFFLGMGKLRKNFLMVDEAVALFVTTFFHGIYYFCFISSDIRLFFVTTVGFIIIGIALVFKSFAFQTD